MLQQPGECGFTQEADQGVKALHWGLFYYRKTTSHPSHAVWQELLFSRPHDIDSVGVGVMVS